jgi:hypothetical protein
LKGTFRLTVSPGRRFDSGRFLSTLRHRLEASGARPHPIPHGITFSDWAVFGQRFPLQLDGELLVPRQQEPLVRYRVSTSRSFMIVVLAMGIFAAGVAYFDGRAALLTCGLLAALGMLAMHLTGTIAALIWLRLQARRAALDTTGGAAV